MDQIILNPEEAVEIVKQQGYECAVLHNPDHIFPPVEIFPLAEKITTPRENLIAILLEMEGTIVSTENLNIYAIEMMIRQISGRTSKDEWHGIDKIIDYPNLVGSTTMRHIEFLINRYNNFIKQDFLKEAFFYSALWLLILGKDSNLKTEVSENIEKLGLSSLLSDNKLGEFVNHGKFDKTNEHVITNYFLFNYGKHFIINNFHQLSAAALIIFHQIYFSTLEKIRRDEIRESEQNYFGTVNKHFVEPVRNSGFFLTLLKGYFGEDIKLLSPSFIDSYKEKLNFIPANFNPATESEKLIRLSELLRNSPPKIAIVSSTSNYETDILLETVIKTLEDEINSWQLSEKKKVEIKKGICDRNIFDVVVTTSDSGSLKLKSHRDYYRMALQQCNIQKKDFYRVAGFGTNESSVIAIRAAGIGLAVALPFAKIEGHTFSAASFILQSGLQEAIIKYSLFLKI